MTRNYRQSCKSCHEIVNCTCDEYAQYKCEVNYYMQKLIEPEEVIEFKEVDMIKSLIYFIRKNQKKA